MRKIRWAGRILPPSFFFAISASDTRYTAATMPAAPKSAKKKTTAPKKSPVKNSTRDFAAVFSALRQILESVDGIAVQMDKPGTYYTEIPGLLHRGKPLFFAGIKTGKNYVSYHLLPVYYRPELNDLLSPELKKRKQGKACFNFTSIDKKCFAELRKLSAHGLKIFKSAEFREQLKRLQ
jgi:hypothetical protein